MEIVKLDTQQEVQNVAVFISEHFDKEQLDQAIRELTASD
jgi:hypothetical protein